MKRSRFVKKAAKPSALPTDAQAFTHFRRCHVCNEMNECDGANVTKCSSCGKHMAPFYFFDDDKIEPLSDCDMRPNLIEKSRLPVRGLTAFW